MAVNWIDDIAPMFTQYDVIQMKWHFDLSDYNTVKTYAQAILMAVSASHPNTVAQMPKYEDPWTQEMMNTFQEWVQEGFRYSAASPDPPPAPAPDPLLPVFVAVSEILTGFDGLDQNQQLAQTYLTRLRKETANGALLDNVLAQFEPGIGNPQQLEPDVLASADLFTQGAQPAPTELAQQIIILWYTATIMNAQNVYVFGTPADNQYTSALVWPGIKAHPMGYSTEDFGYWDKPPDGTLWTGLNFYSKP
jgi:hypothetical protein